MSRPPRIVFAGALYHVTSRGNRRAIIFADDKDYLIWQDILAATVARCKVAVHAFCQMPNHFHLLIETPDGNLPQAMHYLNSIYARRHNGRHSLVGHVTQGRYYSVLVEREEQLLEVARYIALNPVRAQLCSLPEDWRWGSHRYYCGLEARPEWLGCSAILSRFGEKDGPQHSAYRSFVASGIPNHNPLAGLSERDNGRLAEGLSRPSLQDIADANSDRAAAMATAYRLGGYSRKAIATYFHVSLRTVDRALANTSDSGKDQVVSAFVPDPDVDTGSAVGLPPVLA